MSAFVFMSNDERCAWDRFVAGSLADEDCSIASAIHCADQICEERRKRFPKRAQVEAVRTAEMIALRALVTEVAKSLAGETVDLLTAYNRVEAARAT